MVEKDTLKKKIIIVALLILALAISAAIFIVIKNKDVRNSYKVTYNYAGSYSFFYDIKKVDYINKIDGKISLPKVKEDYEQYFLGWYEQKTENKIENKDLISKNITLEARFTGLYQKDVLVKVWNDLIKEEKLKVVSSTLVNANPSLKGKLIIDKNIFKINKNAFAGCTNLTSIVLHKGVKEIGQQSFLGCTGLTNVIIPDEVTIIDSYAFKNCTNLKKLTIPNNVLTIGEQAFAGCTSLTSVTIPKSVEQINSSAFSGCTNLKEIIVEEGNSIYDSRNNCNAIIEKEKIDDYNGSVIPAKLLLGCKTTVIPEDVNEIGYEAFANCTSLKSIVIPKNVKIINFKAFYNCSGLESIIVDNDNDVFDSRDNCNAIIQKSTKNLVVGCKNTIIPYGVEQIYQESFAGCTGLTNITIPNSVVSIGTEAFKNCTSLTSITIPTSVTDIKTYNGSPFSGCDSLTSIIVEEGNTIYDSRNNCNAVIEKLTNKLILGCEASSIPENVTIIGQFAFGNCRGLENFIIPENIKEIEYESFSNCSNLKSITISTGLNTLEANAFSNCTSLTSVTIPSNIIEIRNNAFSDCINLTNVTFEEGVKIIGTEAFINCTKLTNLDLPNSIETINASAFKNCISLTYIVIPASVTQIDAYGNPFVGCTGLNSIVVEEGNSIFDSRDNCNAIIEKSTNKLIVGCKSSIIPNEVQIIGMNAFAGCTGLNELTISSSVKEIEFYAFSGCTNLKNVVFTEGLERIEGSAFSDCISLTSITIPASVTFINSNPFMGCTALTSIIVAEGNTVYDSRNNCNAIINKTDISLIAGCKTTVIPDGVTSIGYYAFFGCTGLTSIIIPESVESLQDGAFVDTGLTSIIIPKNVSGVGFEYGDGAFGGYSTLIEITLDSNNIDVYEFNQIIKYSKTVYVKTTVDVSGNLYLLESFEKLEVSDRLGYDKYVR